MNEKLRYKKFNYSQLKMMFTWLKPWYSAKVEIQEIPNYL